MRIRRVTLLVLVALSLVACQSAPVSQATGSPLEGTEKIRREASNAHLTLAAAYYMKGDQNTALDESTAAVTLDGSNAEAFNIKALVESQLQYHDRAKASFRTAVALASQNPDIRNNFGFFLCGRAEYEEGLAQLRLAYSNSLYKEAYKAYLNAARCALDSGDLKQARELIQTALARAPQNPSLWLALAELSYREGRFDDAAKHLDERHTLQAPNAESLWLGYKVFKKLGNSVETSSFGAQLKNRFPGSREAALFKSGAVD